MVKSVTLDGPAFQAGINAGDEILAINGMRVLKDRFNEHPKFLKTNQVYRLTIARLGIVSEIDLLVGSTPKKIKSLKIGDKGLVEKALK
jgi:predicted metalloprotease with PDZ domain